MAPPSSARSVLTTAFAAGIAFSFAFGAALVTSVISAAPASAHATLVKITPAASARLTSAPTEVVVEFDEPVSTTFATVLVTTSAGISVAQGKAAVVGAKITQALDPNLASGDYRIAFQATSDDGHPVTGESKFTLALTPGSGPTKTAEAPSATVPVTAASSPQALPAGDPKAGQEGSLTRFLVPIAGGLALLLIGAGLLMWQRRRH